MRCWRLPDGGVLVETTVHGRPEFHRLDGSRVAASWRPRVGDDCELFYVWGHRVAGDRFEECTTVEVGPPAYRTEVTPGPVLLTGLVELPEVPPQVPATLELAAAVEQLYAASAGTPRPDRMAGCPHCRPAGGGCELLRPSRRDLDPATLEEYLSAAVTTWGSAADFRWFAPRIAELAVTDQIRDTDLEIVLGKFALAGWTGWPERAALATLWDRWWTLALAAHPGARPAGEVLGALGTVTDLAPLLDRWAALDTPAAGQHLRDLARARVTPARAGRLKVPFWGRAESDQLARWLLSPGLAAAVEAAFYRATGPAADALAELHGYLVPA